MTLKKSLLCIDVALLLSIISHLLYSFTIHTYDIFFSVYLVFLLPFDFLAEAMAKRPKKARLLLSTTAAFMVTSIHMA